jgi:hypothetical protein
MSAYSSMNRPSAYVEGSEHPHREKERRPMTTTMNETVQPPVPSYSECPNQTVRAANGVDYAFRELGDGAVPLVLLQHFRGKLDYRDPALLDALAVGRQVILFDNAGAGKRMSVPDSAAGSPPLRPSKPERTSSPATIVRPAA